MKGNRKHVRFPRFILAILFAGLNLFTVLTVFAGGTTTFGTTSNDIIGIGEFSSPHYVVAQDFVLVGSGNLSEIVVYASSNVGSPSGDITWSIHADDAGGSAPGTLLESDTFTLTPSSENIIPVTSSVYLTNGVKYWLQFEAPGATGGYYVLFSSTGNPYAGGYLWQYDESTWNAYTTQDLRGSVTVVDPPEPTETPTNEPTETPTPTLTVTPGGPTVTPLPTDTPVPTIDLSYIGTLPSDGELYQVERRATFGDMGIVSTLLYIAIVDTVALFLTVTKFIQGRS